MSDREIEVHRYEDPWNLPFEERLRLLKRRVTRVAYFYEQPDNSTFRYRVYNPVNVLNRLSKDVSASYFFRGDHIHLRRVIDASDILVVCRCKYTHELNELITRFRARGKPVLYDIDDFVFDGRFAPLVAETIGIDLREDRGWDTWFAYVSRHGAAVQLCDACITTNRHLARRLHEYTGLPVRLMRNFMNAEQIDMSNRVRGARTHKSLSQQSDIRIGYFSGTPTHARDFAVAKAGIIDLMRQDSRIHLVVAGYMSVETTDDSVRSRIHHQPFTDFVNLQRMIGMVHVNVIPLIHNAFTDCKSELKFFEAAVVGTPSVATPTATLKDCIRHDENGLLSASHEWSFQLKRLISDEALYERLIQEGQNTALSLYSWETRLTEVRLALGLESVSDLDTSTASATLA